MADKFQDFFELYLIFQNPLRVVAHPIEHNVEVEQYSKHLHGPHENTDNLQFGIIYLSIKRYDEAERVLNHASVEQILHFYWLL